MIRYQKTGQSNNAKVQIVHELVNMLGFIKTDQSINVIEGKQMEINIKNIIKKNQFFYNLLIIGNYSDLIHQIIIIWNGKRKRFLIQSIQY